VKERWAQPWVSFAYVPDQRIALSEVVVSTSVDVNGEQPGYLPHRGVDLDPGIRMHLDLEDMGTRLPYDDPYLGGVTVEAERQAHHAVLLSGFTLTKAEADALLQVKGTLKLELDPGRLDGLASHRLKLTAGSDNSASWLPEGTGTGQRIVARYLVTSIM
jgi:hypothetical protein